MRKTITIIVIAIAIFTLGIQTAKAQPVVESTNVSIQLNTDYSADITLDYKISNTDPNLLISGKEVTVPFIDIENPSATLNGIAVTSDIVSSNRNSIVIKIAFNEHIISSGNSANLQLKFRAKNIVESNKEIKEFVVVDNYSNANQQIDVYYPKQWGNPSFYTQNLRDLKEINSNTSFFALNGSSKYLILWGDSYNLDLKFNRDLDETSSNSYFLLNLPKNNTGTEVNYKNIQGSEKGVFDSADNYFALIQLSKPTQIGFEVNVSRKLVNDSTVENTEIEFDKNSKIGKEIWEKIKDVNDSKIALEIANDLLASKSTNDLNQKADITKIFEKENNFNAFESCYILAGVANTLNLESQIDYGYAAFPFQTKLSPHVWCKFKIDNTIFIADPLMQRLTEFKYFGAISDFDRLKVGSWNIQNKEDIVLGLLSQDAFMQELVVSQDPIGISTTNTMQITPQFPSVIASGLNYEATLLITNRTPRLIKITDIKLNDNSVISSTTINNKFYPLVLPGVINKFEINQKINSFFKHGADEIEIRVQFDDNYIQQEKAKAFVTYSLNTTLVWLGLAGTLLIVLLVIFIIFNARKVRRRLNIA